MSLFNHGLYAHALKTLTSEEFKDLKIFISGPDREGEGEYKIFEHLNNLSTIHGDLDNSINSEKDRCLVVGNDSDLILFSLLSESNLHIDFLRIDNSFNATIYNINMIKQELIKGQYGDLNRIINDFCFLSILSGSDYIPRLYGYSLVRTYWAYRRMKSNPNNENKYLIDLNDSGMTIFSQVVQEVLTDSLSFSIPKDKQTVVIKYKGKEKVIYIFDNEHKSNLNNIKQTFFPHDTINYETKEQVIYEDSGRFKSEVVLIKPDGTTIPLAEGYGPTKKNSENNAAQNALHHNGFLLQKLIKPKINQEDFDKLLNSLNFSDYVEEIDVAIDQSFSNIETLISKSPSLSNMCYSYIKMVAWTMAYMKGSSINFSSYYNYIVTPSFLELANFINEDKTIKYVTSENTDNQELSLKYDTNSMVPIASYFCVNDLNEYSIQHAPKNVQQVVKSFDRPILNIEVSTNEQSITINDNTETFLSYLNRFVEFKNGLKLNPAVVFLLSKSTKQYKDVKFEISHHIRKYLPKNFIYDEFVCLKEEPKADLQKFSLKSPVRKYNVLSTNSRKELNFNKKYSTYSRIQKLSNILRILR